MITIFVDVDGVLADFDKRYFELFGTLEYDETRNNFNHFIAS